MEKSAYNVLSEKIYKQIVCARGCAAYLISKFCYIGTELFTGNQFHNGELCKDTDSNYNTLASIALHIKTYLT